MILIVAYDLHNPDRDYPAIEKVLTSADGGSTHPQGSVWLIDTTEEPSYWRDRMKDAGDANDEYLVARLHRHWASFNLDKGSVAWLKDPRRRW